jgi:hydrogenase expression/formation protein HypE
MAIMLARGDLDIEADIRSDSASLHPLIGALLDAPGEVHCLRDATRGGVATVLNEIALDSGVGIRVDDATLPVRNEVRAACEILGMDPLHVANEGKLVAIVAPAEADAMVAALRACPGGEDACVIGEVLPEPVGRVLLRTPFGGTRVLDMLVGDPLPRIC